MYNWINKLKTKIKSIIRNQISPKPPPRFIAVTSFSVINSCLFGKVSVKTLTLFAKKHPQM